MKRRMFLSSVAGAAAIAVVPAFAAAPSALPEIEIFKSPYCGCCGQWADHLSAAGFKVKVTKVDDIGAARKRLGMPDKFGSCHTASVAGYALEGHVPAEEVKKLLAARPAAIGLAVPGMPPSSPGMDASRKDPYEVLLIDRHGSPTVFGKYPKA